MINPLVLLLLVYLYTACPIIGFTTVSPTSLYGVNEMVYDMQRNLVIGACTYRNTLCLFNPARNTTVYPNVSGLNSPLSVALIWDTNSHIVAYLASSGACLVRMNADMPYEVSLISGNCSQPAGSISPMNPLSYADGLSGWTNGGYLLADIGQSSILSVWPNGTTIPLLVNLSNVRKVIYLPDVLINGTPRHNMVFYVMSQQLCIMNGTSGVCPPAFHQVSALRTYDSLILMVNSRTVYYGYDPYNLSSIPCSLPNWLTISDILMLPNGSILIADGTYAPVVYTNCTLNGYNVSHAQTRSTSMSPSLSQTVNRSQSTSVNPTTSRSVDQTRSTSAGQTLSTSVGLTMNRSVDRTRSTSVGQTLSTSNSVSKSYTKGYTIEHTKGYTSRSNSRSNTDIPSVFHMDTHSVTHMDTPSRSITRSIIVLLLGTTLMPKGVPKGRTRTATSLVAPIVATHNPARTTIGAITVSAMSVVSATNGLRTTAVLAILSGQCGSTRQLELYENPFGGRLIALGDLAFLACVLIALSLIGLIHQRFTKGETSGQTFMVRYCLIDTVYASWTVFVPPMIVGLFEYASGEWEILSCILGVIYMLVVLIAVLACVNDVEIDPNGAPGKVSWKGEPISISLVEGYTSKKAFVLDILTMFALTGSTMLDNCNTLAWLTIAINLSYAGCLVYLNGLQPKMILWSTAVLSIGQSCGIIAYLTGHADGQLILYAIYAISLLSVVMTIMPIILRLFAKESTEVDPIRPYGMADMAIDIELDLLSLGSSNSKTG